MKRLTGAAKLAHDRRVLREAHEREMSKALANIRRRDAGSIEATMRHLRRALVLEAVMP